MVSPPTPSELAAYFDRLAELLKQEEAADQARTALLATRCSFDELAQRGLAVNGLSVSGVSLGLGGKSLVSLTRSSAFHADPKLPSHGFRNGEPAKLVAQSAVRKAAGKAKGGAADDEEGEVEGVVYKVTDTSLTLAVSEPKDGDDLEFPERCRLVKTANVGTFDRMEKAIERVRRILQVPASSPPTAAPPGAAATAASEPDQGVKVDPAAGEDGAAAAAAKDGSTSPSAAQGDAAPSADPAASASDASPVPSPLDADPEVDGASDVQATAETPPAARPPPNHPSLKLLQALYGLAPASFSPDFETVSSIEWFDETLNASQQEAVRFVLSMDEVACIHGPPGTGKTHTLVEVIRQLVSVQNKRVLVCGASNLSVDNLLLRLAPVFSPTQITRIGHPARILPALLPSTLDYQTAHSSSGEIVKDVKGELEGHLTTLAKSRKEKGAVKGKKRGEVYGEVRDLRKEFRKREGKVVRDVLSTTQIVLATCHTAGSRQILREDFDVVIIDEATQALEAVCLIPILKAKKLILAGDPCQLGPTILSAKPSGLKPVVDQKKPAKDKKGKKGAAAESAEATTAPGPDTSSPGIEGPAQGDLDDAPSALSPDEQLASSKDAPDDVQLAIDGDYLAPLKPLKPPRTLELTLFGRLERLYGPAIKRILTVQYRMNTAIAAFPSKALYSSLLQSAPSVAARTLAELPGVDGSDDAGDCLSPTVVFIDTAGCEFYERTDEGGVAGEGSKRNENEAELVRKYVERLIAFNVPPKDIAVLAAYQAQVAHIAALLKPDHPELLIGTVDSLQGQEREAVVVSLVRSNAQREVGFLSEERRLNVAMTRAKRQLCVVGDSGTVANGSAYLKAWMGWLEEHAEVRFAMDE